MKLIRHPLCVTGLFVSIIISISIQSRQTVSVSGRTRPFLSSFVHIQKLRMEMKYCNFVIEQNWTGPVAQTQPLNIVCTFKITGLWMLLKPAIALPQTGAVFQRSHETVLLSRFISVLSKRIQMTVMGARHMLDFFLYMLGIKMSGVLDC